MLYVDIFFFGQSIFKLVWMRFGWQERIVIKIQHPLSKTTCLVCVCELGMINILLKNDQCMVTLSHGRTRVERPLLGPSGLCIEAGSTDITQSRNTWSRGLFLKILKSTSGL